MIRTQLSTRRGEEVEEWEKKGEGRRGQGRGWGRGGCVLIVILLPWHQSVWCNKEVINYFIVCITNNLVLTYNHHFDGFLGNFVNSLTCHTEYIIIFGKEVLALHSLQPREGAQKQGNVHIIESFPRISSSHRSCNRVLCACTLYNVIIHKNLHIVVAHPWLKACLSKMLIVLIKDLASKLNHDWNRIYHSNYVHDVRYHWLDFTLHHVIIWQHTI